MKPNIPINYLQMVIAGNQVIIEALTWHEDTVVRELPDGTKQEPRHTAVVIINQEYIYFL